MAVQKSRRTRSTRKTRRHEDALVKPTLSFDSETGELHRRHHITAEGYYRGRQIIEPKAPRIEDDEAEEAAA